MLVGLRILLGLFEGAIFPGLIYLVSLWYTRCMQSFPLSVLLIINIVAQMNSISVIQRSFLLAWLVQHVEASSPTYLRKWTAWVA